ncbi:SMP-30/gluconolactonase/LRE family protein [uncultured Jatrophihabitans sp.]|uniref:SMP-30/gluconolactonase/LRE family protein n=1 Tax=uncultured Jatrophihabitans sp. TaxID=1610747 RepID=UPI0035CB4415
MPLQLIHPKRWTPPRAPERARRTTSVQPLPPLRRLELPAAGPEDVVVDAQGRVLAGLGDGRIVRVDPSSGATETVANTGGRPLGLEPCPDGTLLVCDSRRGLLRVDPTSGGVDVLVGDVDDGPLNFASNVVFDDTDGSIYFSASTRRFDLEHHMGDILEHSGTGRLFRRDADGTVETLLDGLDFANGVVLAPDRSFVLVAQTARYCVTRYWLSGPAAGTSDTLIDNLPGFPDNMALGSDGLVWISLPTQRNPLLDRLLPLPGVLRQLVWLLPEKVQPKPAKVAWVLGVSLDGEVVHDLQGADVGYAFVTSVWERSGTLYLGSLTEKAIGVVELAKQRS